MDTNQRHKSQNTCDAKTTCNDCRIEIEFKVNTRYRLYCNNCGEARRQEKIKATNITRYGRKNIFSGNEGKNIAKKGVLNKYGRENIFSGEEGKEVAKKGMFNKYGVSNAMQDKEIQEKSHKTRIERYGDNLVGICRKDKTEETNLRKYGAKYFFGSESGRMSVENLKSNYDWSDKDLEKFLAKKTLSLNLRASKTSLRYLLPLSDLFIDSGYVNKSDIRIGYEELTEFSIQKYSYDFCIEKLKIIVEFHSYRFHTKERNSYWIQAMSGKSSEEIWDRDMLKKQLAEDNGFSIYYIWEDNSIEIVREIYENHIKKLRNN